MGQTSGDIRMPFLNNSGYETWNMPQLGGGITWIAVFVSERQHFLKVYTIGFGEKREWNVGVVFSMYVLYVWSHSAPK